MSKKVFIEKTKEIGELTVVLDWSMAKYGVTVVKCKAENLETYVLDPETGWQTETYEFKDKKDAESAFNLAVELCTELIFEIGVV